MRFFVIRGKQAAMYAVLAAAAVALLFVSNQYRAGQPVSAGGRLLPIYNVEHTEKVAAVTFDAAWEDTDTADILNILDKYGVKATFFVTGDFVDRCGGSVKAFFDAGHEIANHSDAHPHPNRLSRDKLIADTNACTDKITALTGKKPTLYRAPYGEYNDQVITTVKELGYRFIQWDVDSLDYKNPTPEKMIDRITGRIQPGSILLFHNGTKVTAKTLPAVLERLTQDGYQFLPVGALLHRDSDTVDTKGMLLRNVGAVHTID